MALNLIKLCVGAESIADLEEWIALRLRLAGEQIHTTRMMPKNREAILEGGSLFWVIKGLVSCRQGITDLRGRRGEDGISRCDIVLDPRVIHVDPRPRGPFQGWRYLRAADAPPDLAGAGTPDANLPIDLLRQLRVIGLV